MHAWLFRRMERTAPVVVRVWTAVLPAVLFAWLAVLPVTTRAAGPLPISAAVNRTLVGSRGGTADVYRFTMPQNTAEPVVHATFTPASEALIGQVGLALFLNGTPIGASSPDPTVQGQVDATLPQNPSGIVVVQVFTYSPVPVSYTITTANVPAGAPNAPGNGGSSISSATPLDGQTSGNLPANTGGAFVYYTFPSAGGVPPATLSMTYSPADNTVSQAVGMNVYDENQNLVGSATQATSVNQATDTMALSITRPAGEPLTLQVYNYAVGVSMTYSINLTGVAPAVAPSAAPSTTPKGVGAPALVGFQAFWVENFVRTPLWSGSDAHAVSFGDQTPFSSFLVVSPQTGSRLYVYNPATHDYAYIDARAVGPSGPPA